MSKIRIATPQMLARMILRPTEESSYEGTPQMVESITKVSVHRHQDKRCQWELALMDIIHRAAYDLYFSIDFSVTPYGSSNVSRMIRRSYHRICDFLDSLCKMWFPNFWGTHRNINEVKTYLRMDYYQNWVHSASRATSESDWSDAESNSEH